MRGFLAFTKKEFREQARTYKWLIVLSVFFLFGLMSPLLAKMTPVLISSMDMGGVTLTLPKPTAMDAYAQYFKNMTQMGIVVLLLIFGGTLSNELVKGTLVNILAKGLSRAAVLLSKYTAAVILWSAGFLLSAVTNYGYTAYLFGEPQVPELIFSMFCLWLFGCFIIALILLSSTLAAGSFGGLILSAVTLFILLLVNILPKAEKFNPVTLASKNTALLNGTVKGDSLYLTIGITIALTVLCLVISILMFRKKKI